MEKGGYEEGITLIVMAIEDKGRQNAFEKPKIKQIHINI
jgi:hypothetical protein